MGDSFPLSFIVGLMSLLMFIGLLFAVHHIIFGKAPEDKVGSFFVAFAVLPFFIYGMIPPMNSEGGSLIYWFLNLIFSALGAMPLGIFLVGNILLSIF